MDSQRDSLFSIDTRASDSMDGLQEEYEKIVQSLREQGRKQAPELLMRLTVIMIDLGLYRPSPP